ncbi:MAG: hypothetical protein V3W41_16015 [Planctomycetota bacterium]
MRQLEIITLVLLSLAFLGVAQAQSEAVRTQYPSGKKKAEYRIDAKGQHHGAYVDYYESGQLMRRAKYFHGKLDGKFESWHQSGKRAAVQLFKRGVVVSAKLFAIDGAILHELKTKRGKLLLILAERRPVTVFPKSKAEIRKRLAKIDTTLTLNMLDAGLSLGQRLSGRDAHLSRKATGGSRALIFRPLFSPGTYKPGLAVLVKICGLKLPKKQVATYIV